ncbi:hypothetical protein Taro_049262 [Colocasia esculenta]|uniref:Uncharacterized protein n=1 Tax=Colocasia esculenta TaxID=4460 RepID=A0A843XAH1_COLES|nr:hypothetical protein [Colocasia esculenta]
MEREAKGKGKSRADGGVSSTEGVGHDDEEQQMEKFFALVKNVREMREQQRRAGGDEMAKRTKVEQPQWRPTFEWEDFRGTANLRKSPAGAIPGTSEVGGEGKEKKEEEAGLDLNLSL